MAARTPREALNPGEVKSTIAKSVFIPFPGFSPSEQRPKTREERLDQIIHNINGHHAAVRQNIIRAGRQAIEHPAHDIPNRAPAPAYLRAINDSVITSLDSQAERRDVDTLIRSNAPSPRPITDEDGGDDEGFQWPLSHPVAVTLHAQAALEEYNSHSMKTVEGYRQILRRSSGALASHPNTNPSPHQSRPGHTPLAPFRSHSYDKAATAANTIPVGSRPSNAEASRRASMAGPMPSPMEDVRPTTAAACPVAPMAPMMAFTGKGLQPVQIPTPAQTPTQMQARTPTPTQTQRPKTPVSNVVDASRDPRQRRR